MKLSQFISFTSSIFEETIVEDVSVVRVLVDFGSWRQNPAANVCALERKNERALTCISTPHPRAEGMKQSRNYFSVTMVDGRTMLNCHLVTCLFLV